MVRVVLLVVPRSNYDDRQGNEMVYGVPTLQEFSCLQSYRLSVYRLLYLVIRPCMSHRLKVLIDF